MEAAKSVRRVGSLGGPPELLECPHRGPGRARVQNAESTSWTSIESPSLSESLLLSQGGGGVKKNGKNTLSQSLRNYDLMRQMQVIITQD